MSQTPSSAPGGRVWLHASNDARGFALIDLAQRITSLRGDVSVFMTAPDTASAELQDAVARCLYVDDLVRLGRDSNTQARRFLSKREPDLCLWAGGGFYSSLLDRARQMGMAMTLFDLQFSDLSPRSKRRWWLTDPDRYAIDCFGEILIVDMPTHDALRKLSVPEAKIRRADRLAMAPMAPECAASALADITDQLRGRPVWLAAHARPEEFAQILEAHRQAVRRAPRLLLILMPDTAADMVELERNISLTGLNFVNWSDGDDLSDAAQIALADGTDRDVALWLRAAPVCFLGASLVAEAGGRSPQAAATLGSAIIHGPNVSHHRFIYDRLRQAGATHAVRDAKGLTKAVQDLSAPDLAARMALAGWQSMTEGAQLLDQIADSALDHLDRRAATHARA